MYIQNLTVDGNVLKLPELFNATHYGATDLEKKVLTDDEYEDGPYPTNTLYWPVNTELAAVRSYRGHGAFSFITGGGTGFVIKLNTNTKYPSIIDDGTVTAKNIVAIGSDSVISDVPNRSLWQPIVGNVRAPNLGSSDTAASYIKHIRDGDLIKGVAFRVMALALEHALAPFTMRTRVRNATACYWSTGKYSRDGQTFCIQGISGLNPWMLPTLDKNKSYEPKYVVWVGDASYTQGMSLLSRIMDAGGPMHTQRSYLLEQFTPGSLLMAGSGLLNQELRPIQPNNLNDAISEALTILVRYNCLEESYLNHILRLLIRNLPAVDKGFYAERNPIFWNTSRRDFGAFRMDDESVERLTDHLNQTVGGDTLRACGIDQELACGMFSDVARRQLLAPREGLNDHAPPLNFQVPAIAAAFVASIQVPANVPLDNEPVSYCVLSVERPPALPAGLPPPSKDNLVNVWPVISGKCPHRIFAFSNPGVGDDVPVLMPGFRALHDIAALNLGDVIPLQNGVWQEWVGGLNDAGPIPFPINLRGYIVRYWVPVIEAQLPEHFVPPQHRLRNFDLPGHSRIQARNAGEPFVFEGVAPRVHQFLADINLQNTPLDIFTEEGMRTYAHWTVAQRTVVCVAGMAYLWECASYANVMNDAFGRWMRHERRGVELTTVPDELLVYTGGLRSTLHLHGCGGLWVLCYLPSPGSEKLQDVGGDVMGILRDPDLLAAYMSKLRCAIEVSDQLGRVSDARVAGGTGMSLYDEVTRRRLEDAFCTQHTVVDASTQLTRQALFMHLLFDHPDSYTVSTLGVRGIPGSHLKSTRRQDVFGMSGLRYLSWVTPQICSNEQWIWYLGVTAPSFVLDREGWAKLATARNATVWTNYNKEVVLPGSMMHIDDEIWAAILTSSFGSRWDLNSLHITMLGTSHQIYVGDIRHRKTDFLSPLQCRLNLPHETTFASVVMPAQNPATMMRPRLSANVRDAFEPREITPRRYEYNAAGSITFGDFDDPGLATMYLRDNFYGQAGFDRGVIDYESTPDHYAPTMRKAGSFFLRPVQAQGLISPAMCPAAARVIKKVAPNPIPAAENAGGQPPSTDVNLNRQMPDPEIVRNASDGANISNLPAVEINIGQHSLTSSISTLSGDALDEILNALLKRKEFLDGGGTATTSGESASTPDN